MTVLGCFLGRVAFVRSHIDLIPILIVAVSVLPIAIHYLRSRRRAPARW